MSLETALHGTTRILAIETSCDETAAAIIDATGTPTAPSFTRISHALHSQIDTHAQYGGVFPMLAKREHTSNIIPVLVTALADAELLIKKSERPDRSPASPDLSPEQRTTIATITDRDQGLNEVLVSFLNTYEKPRVDYIAVTYGPGLEPALWVGINTARVLSTIWNIPLIGVNHMEGHVISPLLAASAIDFPAVALIASGGHTELLAVTGWGKYSLLGQTRDDAVGEAFDKVARTLGLSYPGGPQVSKFAADHRERFPTWNAETDPEHFISFPRPMHNSKDFDFSFSGLKTAVLYYFRDLPKSAKSATELSATIERICRAFEDAAVEVLVTKTMKACEEYSATSLIIGGGVIANAHLRATLEHAAAERGITVYMPTPDLATDNAVMIGMAAYLHTHEAALGNELQAKGRLPLSGATPHRDVLSS